MTVTVSKNCSNIRTKMLLFLCIYLILSYPVLLKEFESVLFMHSLLNNIFKTRMSWNMILQSIWRIGHIYPHSPRESMKLTQSSISTSNESI